VIGVHIIHRRVVTESLVQFALLPERGQRMREADFQSHPDNQLIKRFCDYQVNWLMSHNDIELEPQMEELIINFLRDTASCFILEDSE